MARSEKQPESESPSRRLALSEPRVTALSDHALSPQDYEKDTFSLIYRLGPILDILRHPDTRTPLAIAVYGDWGSGKTSGMKWLHGLLDTWNEEGKAGDKITVKPVWFYPWKYHDKEDVWRGLISEVIIGSIGVENASVATVTNAVKQFGMFLGRGFVHVLAGLTLKAGEAGPELSLAGIKDILAEYRELSHPEKAFLNEFESALQKWVSDNLGGNERMVIFIDDLDRCMPDVALEVLEALKLYLNIPKLIFVVGVDKGVVDELVKQYYGNLKLAGNKSANYLAKMFQVEVELAVPESQIGAYLDQQLKAIPYWYEELSDEERDLFRSLILECAGRNPREVKRLINSALMEGAGTMMIAGELKFRQGLQLFFLRKTLAERYTRSFLVGSQVGDDFFAEWSRIVQNPGALRTLRVPEEYIAQIRDIANLTEGKVNATHLLIEQPELVNAEFAPDEYYHIVTDARFDDILPLLADERLGELMRVPYPREAAAAVSAVTGADLFIIREAAARKLRLKPEEMSEEQFRTVEQLDLSGTQVSDIESLGALANLEILDLRGTQVSDIEPLRALANLAQLFLSRIQVSDIEPLRALVNLEMLGLRGTQVSDIEPLRALVNLQWLDLSGTRVSPEALAALRKDLPDTDIITDEPKE